MCLGQGCAVARGRPHPLLDTARAVRASSWRSQWFTASRVVSTAINRRVWSPVLCSGRLPVSNSSTMNGSVHIPPGAAPCCVSSRGAARPPPRPEPRPAEDGGGAHRLCHLPRGTLRRAFCLPCGHSYCDTCTARALWDKPSCPSCRAEVKTAAPAWEQRGKEEQANATLISVRHRGVAFTVDLVRGECPYERTSIMFSVTINRLKLICRGKQLPRGSDPQLAGAVIQLIGSRQEQHLHDGRARYAGGSRGVARLDTARAGRSPARLRVPTWRSASVPGCSMPWGWILFFASLLPVQCRGDVAAQVEAFAASFLAAPKNTKIERRIDKHVLVARCQP